MPDFVKPFWYFTENTSAFPLIIKGLINLLGNWHELVNLEVFNKLLMAM